MKILAILTFESSITIAYSILGFLSLMAYLPQIRALFKAKGASKEISLQTWSIWTMDSVVSFMYTAFVLQDLIASLIFSVDCIGALCILGLAAKNRYRAGEFSIRSERRAALGRE